MAGEHEYEDYKGWCFVITYFINGRFVGAGICGCSSLERDYFLSGTSTQAGLQLGHGGWCTNGSLLSKDSLSDAVLVGIINGNEELVFLLGFFASLLLLLENMQSFLKH